MKPADFPLSAVERDALLFARNHIAAARIMISNSEKWDTTALGVMDRLLDIGEGEDGEDLILGSIANALGMEDYAGLESVMAHARKMREALKGVADHPGCGDFYCNACPCMDDVIRIAKLNKGEGDK